MTHLSKRQRQFEDLALKLEESTKHGRYIASCDTLANVCRLMAKTLEEIQSGTST